MKYILCLICFLFFPHSVFAAPLITEVYPQPESGSEWIELYNPADEAVSLAGWYLNDQLASPSTIYTFYSTEVLESKTYISVEIVNRLNNSADGVSLYNPDQVLIDSMSYSSSSLNQSWAKVDNAFVLSTPSRNLPNPTPSTAPSPSPSPIAAPTPTPQPSPAPDFDPYDIVLSELMACPGDGQPEWIELYNPTDQAINLQNWKVTDWTGNTRLLNAQLEPNSYQTINWLSSMLNNTGDSVFVESDVGAIIAAATFPACNQNQSFIWQNNTWMLTTTPTADTENKLTTISSPLPSSSPTPSPKPSPTPKVSPKPTASPAQILGASTSDDITVEPTPTSKPTAKVSKHQVPPPTLSMNQLFNPSATTSAQFIRAIPVHSSLWPPINVILGGAIIATSSAYMWYDQHRDFFDKILA
jgi:hypothetical protein